MGRTTRTSWPACRGEVERRLSDEDDEGVVDDLREEVTKFEVSHPKLASIINRTADALSAMGL